MRRGLTLLAVISAAAFAPLAACSGDGGQPPAHLPDSGSDDGGGNTDADGATPRTDADGDSSPGDEGGAIDGSDAQEASDAAVPPLGSSLLSGAGTILGLTSDGFVICLQGTTVFAIPLTPGGSTQTVTTGFATATSTAVVSGLGVILSMEPATSGRYHYVWTAAHGLQQLPQSGGNVTGEVALSPDGTHVSFTENVNAGGMAVSVNFIKTDGTGLTVLQDLPGGLSEAFVQFGADGTLIATYTDGSADAGATPTVAAFDGSTFARRMTLANPIGNQVTVAPLDFVWLSGTAGGQLVDSRTGTVLLTDPKGQAGFFDSSAAHLFYRTTAGALVEAGTANTAATMLVSSGCTIPSPYTQFAPLSPDETISLCWTAGPPEADGGMTDAIEAQATGDAGASRPVWSGPSAPVFVAFTADSKQVLVSSQTGLQATPALGGAVTVLGAVADEPFAVLKGSAFAAVGAGGALETFSAVGAKGNRVAEGVSQMRVSAAHDAIVFNVGSGAYAGIYVVPVP